MSEVVLDVLIVGAGLSGIGAAYRVMTECPEKSFAILESRDAIGGTWDLFRYPGIRSDSDMFTLGYPFHPWKEAKAIADGESILEYVRDTARTFGIDGHIRFRHRIVRATWVSSRARWVVDVEVGPSRTVVQYACRFLYLCCGYYQYDEAHRPKFEGEERFQGRIVHPQWWPEDLDYEGKRVVVIGSGATAVTLVPALAGKAAHVTMVQRSPSYVLSVPAKDVVADTLRKVLPARMAHGLARAKNVVVGLGFYQFCRRFPRQARRLLQRQTGWLLPKGFAIDPHFVPRYEPWDQRMCLVPDGDLFKALSSDKASVVTDTVSEFTERGLRLASSGDVLEADVVVTATGLKLIAFGNISLFIDDRRVAPRDLIVYKGLMHSGVPNLAWCVGYTNASWTLRADLSSRYVCRLLKFMDREGYDVAVPQVEEGEGEPRPLLDLSSGYVRRVADEMPKQGARAPFYLRQNYLLDAVTMTMGRVNDSGMSFSRTTPDRA